MRVQSDRAVRNVRYERRARSGRKGATVDAEPRDYQDVIDQALQLTNGNRLDRWRRVALASVKQSKRAVLPDVRRPLTLEAFLGDPPSALCVMLVEPEAGRAEPLSALQGQPNPQDATVFVGPEGGWTEKEIEAARSHGVRLVKYLREDEQ